jgi:hypothetical protein
MCLNSLNFVELPSISLSLGLADRRGRTARTILNTLLVTIKLNTVVSRFYAPREIEGCSGNL